jgi:hypothetical protein
VRQQVLQQLTCTHAICRIIMQGTDATPGTHALLASCVCNSTTNHEAHRTAQAARQPIPNKQITYPTSHDRPGSIPQGSDLNHEVIGRQVLLPTPAHSHNSYALCTILLDIQYRGMLLLQAAPVISPCMSYFQSHPQHKPTPCASTCPAGLQDKCWQEMGVLGMGVMSLCLRQRAAGVLQAGAGVHKCGAGGSSCVACSGC